MRFPRSICAEKESPARPVQDIARSLLRHEEVPPLPASILLFADASPFDPVRRNDGRRFSDEQLAVLRTVWKGAPGHGSASRRSPVVPLRETFDCFGLPSSRGVEEMRAETVIVAGLRPPKDRAHAMEFSFLRDDDIPAEIRHSATLRSLAAGRGESENERFLPGVEGYPRRAGVFSVHFDLAAEVTHAPGAVPSKGKPIPTLQHFGLTCLRINQEQYFPLAAGIANPEFGWSALPLFPVSDGRVTLPATRAEPPRFSRSPRPFSRHSRRRHRL